MAKTSKEDKKICKKKGIHIVGIAIVLLAGYLIGSFLAGIYCESNMYNAETIHAGDIMETVMNNIGWSITQLSNLETDYKWNIEPYLYSRLGSGLAMFSLEISGAEDGKLAIEYLDERGNSGSAVFARAFNKKFEKVEGSKVICDGQEIMTSGGQGRITIEKTGTTLTISGEYACSGRLIFNLA